MNWQMKLEREISCSECNWIITGIIVRIKFQDEDEERIFCEKCGKNYIIDEINSIKEDKKEATKNIERLERLNFKNDDFDITTFNKEEYFQRKFDSYLEELEDMLEKISKFAEVKDVIKA